MEAGNQRLRYRPFQTCAALLALVLCHSILPARDPGFSWLGPGGVTLPFESPDGLEQFLQTARVLEVKEIDRGVTHPRKLLLERDGVRMHAIFRSHDEFKGVWHGPSGVKVNFRDSCYFELAAYRLSKLLAVERVPPVVRRTFLREDFERSRDFGKLGNEREGTLQAWVESAMTEVERRKTHQRPPDFRKWSSEFQRMYLFDSLTFNEDRNLGNILIGPEWRIWLIDSTRSFRPFRELRSPKGIRRCDRETWERLQAIGPEALRRELGDLLPRGVLDCLIARHQALVVYIRDLIASEGPRVIDGQFE